MLSMFDFERCYVERLCWWVVVVVVMLGTGLDGYGLQDEEGGEVDQAGVTEKAVEGEDAGDDEKERAGEKRFDAELYQEYSRRFGDAIKQGPEALMELAGWCREKALNRQAEMLYRRILYKDPDHTEAYRELWRLITVHPPAVNQVTMQQLAKEFDDGFFMKQTDRFVFLYDSGHIWADSRSRLLKQAYEGFYKTLVSDGYRPLPPSQPLVCILFNQFDDYKTYALIKDRIATPASGGYYSPRTNRVQFFNHQTNPAFKKYADEVNRLQSQVSGYQQQLASARERRDDKAIRNIRARLFIAQKNLARARTLFSVNTASNNVSQTFHEAAHQLAFNSGLQARGIFYPFWVSEGLATNFETNNPAIPFGPRKVNRVRQQALKKALTSGYRMNLKQFVTELNPERTDKQQLSLYYAQAWAVFHYLYNNESEALRDYLRMLRTRRGRPDAEALLKEFEDAFGPVGDIERAIQKMVILPDG